MSRERMVLDWELHPSDHCILFILEMQAESEFIDVNPYSLRRIGGNIRPYLSDYVFHLLASKDCHTDRQQLFKEE